MNSWIRSTDFYVKISRYQDGVNILAPNRGHMEDMYFQDGEEIQIHDNETVKNIYLGLDVVSNDLGLEQPGEN